MQFQKMLVFHAVLHSLTPCMLSRTWDNYSFFSQKVQKHTLQVFMSCGLSLLSSVPALWELPWTLPRPVGAWTRSLELLKPMCGQLWKGKLFTNCSEAWNSNKVGGQRRQNQLLRNTPAPACMHTGVKRTVWKMVSTIMVLNMRKTIESSLH